MDNDDERRAIMELVERYEEMQMMGKTVYFDADEFVLLAEFYLEMGTNEVAEEIVDEGIRIHPSNSELISLKAKILIYMDLYEEAESYLNEVPDDGSVDLALLRIEILFHLERAEEANQIINDTMKEGLSIEELYHFISEIGFIMNDIEDYDRAVSFLEESLKIDDSNTEILVDLAFAYEMKSDFENAIKYNNRLLDLNPYSFEGWVNIGKLYSMNGEFDKALDAFDFAHTINENDVSVLKMKALTLYLNENTEEAIRIFEKCIEMSPNDETLYDSLIEGYEYMEQYDKAAEVIDLKEKHFGSPKIAIRRGLLALLQDDIETARELYNKVPKEDIESLDYFMLEGELKFIEEDYRASEAAFIKAALISENNEEIIDRLANVSVAQEKYEQAAEYLEQLLEFDPQYPTAKARLAFIRFEIGIKEPFDEIMEQFTDDELRMLLQIVSGNEETDFSEFNRQKMLVRLNEARENRILFKNIKY